MIISEGKNENIAYNHLHTETPEIARFNTHCHDRYELIFLVKGDITYIAEGRTYRLKHGDIVLSRTSVMHCILPSEDTEYERYCAIIDEKILPSDLRRTLKHGPDVYECAENARIHDLFAKLDYYYQRFPDEEYSHLVFNIIEEVLFNLALLSDESSRADSNHLVASAISYIKDNLTTIKSIDEVSCALYITKSHLHHLFRKHLQITPAKYITTKRLLLAQKMLKRGDKPTVVYNECGFDDYATFFRNYKRLFGYSPTAEGKVIARQEILL